MAPGKTQRCSIKLSEILAQGRKYHNIQHSHQAKGDLKAERASAISGLIFFLPYMHLCKPHPAAESVLSIKGSRHLMQTTRQLQDSNYQNPTRLGQFEEQTAQCK